MPIYGVAVFLAIVACMIIIKLYIRNGMTLDAILKKFEGDPNWDQGLGRGVIEDTAREE